MVDTASNLVNFAVDQKIASQIYEDYSRTVLFNFIRSPDNRVNFLSELVKSRGIELEKDVYGNIKYDFLKIKANQLKSRINILRLFKPGEIIEHIITQE